MSALHTHFSGQVEHFIAKFPGHTLIFFKGFGVEQIQQLITHSNSLLNNASLLENGYINYEALKDNWINFATAIQSATAPLVGFYEELVAIRKILPLMSIDKIVIVENNLLSPWVPCCLPYHEAETLFDYWQAEHETLTDQPISELSQIYGQVKLLKTGKALLLPLSLDDERIVGCPFWSEDEDIEDAFEPELCTDEIEHIESGSTRDWEYRLNITNGIFKEALLLQNDEVLSSWTRAVMCASKLLGFDVFIDELELYDQKVEYNENQFIPVLQKYWGSSACFRPLLFYKDPDHSQETETITQGQIIAEIVDQCETAQNGDPFSNIFITAPTGSGKSILFQIPAIYLAEKYSLVTIVISPLIALMNDQVDQLQHEHGISIAACINSSMSIEERSNVIEQIHSGKKSLLYLAPELLLSTHLESFLGGRRIGLVVIDEAHTVTSWGRDFRSDYWFLGDFLKKTTRVGLTFPVLCLTATAVYSGEDDVVNDTIYELGLEKTIIHLGNVKRHNISFDIQRHNPAEITGKVEEAKIELTLKRVNKYISEKEKVLAYFPYRSQVDHIYSRIPVEDHLKIRRYHGQILSAERKMVERDYKKGTAMGLFCTKAFGMGVDVGDIKHIIHFAPTGTLSDYVQEVGRAARNADIHGIAHIDYFPSDLRYVRSLNGISEMRQYQLREMLKKICSIQKAKKRRNLLISAETFEYLFKEKDVENRTKSGLMLISKDLSSKYTFPVLIVQPKVMLSRNYINVPLEIEAEFLKRYGPYCKFQQNVVMRSVPSQNYRESDVIVYSTGKTFLVDMAEIWENCYPDRSFGMFKKEFFQQEFCMGNKTYTISPRVRVEVRYAEPFETVSHRAETILNAICNIFEKFRHGEIKQFTQKQFETALTEELNEKVIAHDKISMLLDIFTESVNENAVYSQSRNRVRVLRSRKMPGIDETGYFVSSASYAHLANFFTRQIQQCSVNTQENSFVRFYPLNQNKQLEIMPVLRFLELMDLATYEIRGGEKAEVFIRVNDPQKIEDLVTSGKYTNSVLQNIQKRHRNNEKLLAAFFAADMSDDERWELIEQYFLGNEEYVRHILKLDS